MILQDLASDVASHAVVRIKQADAESADATAAFAAGRFEEYWRARAEQVRKRLEKAGEQAIANARDGGEDG